MTFFPWLFRGAERDRAYARLNTVKEAYAEHGSRVIRLSARTELLRKSAGATARSFEFVEKTFADATQAYSQVQDRLDQVEFGLGKGQVGDFPAVEAAVKAIGPKLDELERRLAEWESKWSQTPVEIDQVTARLGALVQQVESASRALGAALPLQERLAAMQAHLEKIRATMAAGNPIEAGYLVSDLRIALDKVSDEAESYISGVGAIEQTERELARVKSLSGDQPSAEAVAALAAAEALLPRLRPALAAGKLEPFQSDLLAVQKQLSAARGLLK